MMVRPVSSSLRLRVGSSGPPIFMIGLCGRSLKITLSAPGTFFGCGTSSRCCSSGDRCHSIGIRRY